MGCGWTSTSHVGFVGTVGFEEGIASYIQIASTYIGVLYIYVLVRRQWTNGGGCGGLGGLGETAAGKDMNGVGGLSFSVPSVLVMLDHTKFSIGCGMGTYFSDKTHGIFVYT